MASPSPSNPNTETPLESLLEVVDVASTREVRGLSEVTRFGRGRNNEVQFTDRQISKQHAEIHRRGASFVLRDLNSRAGLFVNGARVQEHQLVDGDTIGFGDLHLPKVVFRQTRPQKAAAVQPSSDPLARTLAGSAPAEDLQNLARFLGFSRVFAGGVALAEVLDRVVDMAMDITAAERGFLILTGPNDALDFEVGRERGVGALSKESHRVSETIVRDVLERKTPRVVTDIAIEEELAQTQSIKSLDLGSAVAMPLWRFAHGDNEATAATPTDQVFGVLYLDSRQRRDAFSKLDLGLLENLTRDASSAIENARLLREAETKRRMEREIETAREVQAALLPETYWSQPHFAVHGICVPCLELGGDYLGQFELPQGHTAFVVADVCGKGFPAALLAAVLQGALAAEIRSERPLGEIVSRVNRVICELTPTADFISMLCCVLAPDGELTYVNAGHCPLLWITESGTESLVTKGIVIGIEEEQSYQEGRIQMQPGDLALLYSDGVVEADGPGGEFYGEERFLSRIADCRALTPVEVAQRVLDSVESFRGDQPVADDITLLVVQYQGDAG